MAHLPVVSGRIRQIRRKRKAVTCYRCAWTWVPYGTKRPARCANPTCRSPYWHRPKRERPSTPPKEDA